MIEIDTVNLVDTVKHVEEDEEGTGQEEEGGRCQPRNLQDQHEQHRLKMQNIYMMKDLKDV